MKADEIFFNMKANAALETKRIIRRPFRRFFNPFKEALREYPPKILHGCHHRCGTVWIFNILWEVAAENGLIFLNSETSKWVTDADIVFYPHSRVDFKPLSHYVGSHMIRDPRDAIVSGYFYHRWTKEKWCRTPREKLGGKSYQQYLNSLNQDEGLAVEIRGADNLITDITDMMCWNYYNPRFLELKYEDLITREHELFQKLFGHYGFKKSAIERACSIASRYSFKQVARRNLGEIGPKSHFRSGAVGQWKEVFKPQHKDLFKKLYPQVLIQLGYEKNETW